MNKGKISVLMPVYNTNPIFLKESIDSILSQTYPNFELIIVNDGSCNDIDSSIIIIMIQEFCITKTNKIWALHTPVINY